MHDKKTITSAEAARIANKEDRTIRNWCRTVPGLAERDHARAAWRISVDALTQWLERGPAPALSGKAATEALKVLATMAERDPTVAETIIYGRRNGKARLLAQVSSAQAQTDHT